ncbi:MAG: hypothetical protein HYV97_18865 [Bdellovibrio sp.]|nr:hypothetical protein [Bdellovibrio sp.]
MQNFSPLGTYLEIVNTIGRWKVIPLPGLFESFSKQMTYTPFAKRVQALERAGLIRAFTKNRTKYLVLTQEGSRVSKYKNYYNENEDSLNHDMIAANILRQLLRFENFQEGHMFVDDRWDIDPDAVIFAKRGDAKYTLAIEVELTQKVRTRVVNKFSKYGLGKNLNHALYIFNKESCFEAYKQILGGMNDTTQGKIILCCDTGLSFENFSYIESTCWHREAQHSFLQIFK